MAGPPATSDPSPVSPYDEHPSATQQFQSAQDGVPAPAYTPEKPQQTQTQQPQQATPQHAYVTPLERLADQPEEVDCPFCKRRAVTRMQKSDSNMTTVAGVVLCLVCICLACLPCLLGWAQNIDHFCSKCGKQLTHRPHDGTTVVVEAAKAAGQSNNGGAVPPKYGQVPSQYYDPQSTALQQQQTTGEIHAAPQRPVEAPSEKGPV